ncbi:MAG: MerR family DNA-binding protein [Xanthomonadaceae bacterium]|nr:MerR family DNA-binding protein [Xanthomonadaceae bacterium]MDE1964750.1 MerR family DNA-binding protein [Xanthomonadaceae bacterium]
MRFIRHARNPGFSLDQATDLLALGGRSDCRSAKAPEANTLAMVRKRIRQPRRVQRALSELMDQRHCNAGNVRCALMAALDRSSGRGSRVRRGAVRARLRRTDGMTARGAQVGAVQIRRSLSVSGNDARTVTERCPTAS